LVAGQEPLLFGGQLIVDQRPGLTYLAARHRAPRRTSAAMQVGTAAKNPTSPGGVNDCLLAR
jgi:hypothetical protein